LRYALHDFGSVVAHADDGVGAQFGRVLQHEFEGVLARLFAQVGEQRDVAADQRLQSRANGAHDGARAHDDAAYQPEIADDAIASHRESSGDHVVLYGAADRTCGAHKGGLLRCAQNSTLATVSVRTTPAQTTLESACTRPIARATPSS